MWPSDVDTDSGSSNPDHPKEVLQLASNRRVEFEEFPTYTSSHIDDLPVTKWLVKAGLDRYKKKFASYGLRTYLDLVRRADKELLTYMEVHKVHVKKLVRLIAELDETLKAATLVVSERRKTTPNDQIVAILKQNGHSETSIGEAWDLVGNNEDVLPTPEDYNEPIVTEDVKVTFKHPHRFAGRTATVRAFQSFTSAGIRVWELSLENGYKQVAGENRLQVVGRERQHSDASTIIRHMMTALPVLPKVPEDDIADDSSESSMDGFAVGERVETIVSLRSGRPEGSRGTIVSIPKLGKIRVRWDDGKTQTISSLTKIEKVHDETRPTHSGVPIPIHPSPISAALPGPPESRQNTTELDGKSTPHSNGAENNRQTSVRRGVSFRDRISSIKDGSQAGNSTFNGQRDSTPILKVPLSPRLPRVTSYSVSGAGSIDANGIYKPIFDQADLDNEKCRWVKYTSHFTYHIYLIDDEDDNSTTWWLVKCPYDDEHNEMDLYFVDAQGNREAPPLEGWQIQQGGGKFPAPKLRRLRSSIMQTSPRTRKANSRNPSSATQGSE